MFCGKKITCIRVTLFIVLFLLIGGTTVFAEVEFETETFGPGNITETISSYGDIEEFTLTANPDEGSYLKGWVFLEGYFDYEQDAYDEYTIYLFDVVERIVIMAVFGTDNSVLFNDILYSAENITVKLSEVLSGISTEEMISKTNLSGVNVKTNEEADVSEIVFSSDFLPFPGKYPASFSSKSILGDASVNIEIEVIDDIPPVLEATTPMTVNAGSVTATSFTELFGVTAIDGIDGDVTEFIFYDTVIDSIDFTKPGTYSITAQIEDAAGNSTSKELTLIILKEEKDPYIDIENDNHDNNFEIENESSLDYYNHENTAPKTGDKGPFAFFALLITSLIALTAILILKKNRSF